LKSVFVAAALAWRSYIVVALDSLFGTSLACGMSMLQCGMAGSLSMAVEFVGTIRSANTSEIWPPVGPPIDPGYTARFAPADEKAGFDLELIGGHAWDTDGFSVASHAAAYTQRAVIPARTSTGIHRSDSGGTQAHHARSVHVNSAASNPCSPGIRCTREEDVVDYSKHPHLPRSECPVIPIFRPLLGVSRCTVLHPSMGGRRPG
jgi:hypothetical protein